MTLRLLALALVLSGCSGEILAEPDPCMFAESPTPTFWTYCPTGINAEFNCAGRECPAPGVACYVGTDVNEETAPCEPGDGT